MKYSHVYCLPPDRKQFLNPDMRTRIFISSLALLIASIAAPAAGAAIRWETIKTEVSEAKSVVKDTDFEIKTASSSIIINTNHSVKIQVFTILGRLVSSETVQPGISRLTLPAHGVYIVKIGTLTCKIAV